MQISCHVNRIDGEWLKNKHTHRIMRVVCFFLFSYAIVAEQQWDFFYWFSVNYVHAVVTAVNDARLALAQYANSIFMYTVFPYFFVVIIFFVHRSPLHSVQAICNVNDYRLRAVFISITLRAVLYSMEYTCICSTDIWVGLEELSACPWWHLFFFPRSLVIWVILLLFNWIRSDLNVTHILYPIPRQFKTMGNCVFYECVCVGTAAICGEYSLWRKLNSNKQMHWTFT